MSRIEDETERLVSQVETGDPSAAERAVRDALADDPDRAPLRELLGRALFRQGKHEEAIVELEAASSFGALDCSGEAALAHSYGRTGRSELAAWVFRDLRQRAEVPNELLADGAAMLGEVGETQEAFEVCAELRRRNPECHRAAFGMAYYMNRQARPAEEILPLLEFAHAKSSDCVMYRLGLAFCLDRLGRSHAAWEILRGLELDQVHWPHCLSRIMEIASTVGDRAQLLACQGRLRELVGPAAPNAGCG